MSKEDRLKVKVCTGHTRPVCHISYSNIIDGTYWFATSCHDSKPMLRNGETGDWVGTFEGHRGAVYCSSFNTEATRLVTGSGDFSVKLWDAVAGANLHTWQTPHYVKGCDWWGSKVVTGCYDSNVRVFDAENYATEPVVFQADKKNTIKAVYFIEDTNMVVTAADSLIKLWDMRQNSAVKELELTGLNMLDYTHQHYLVGAHGKNLSLIDPKTLAVKSLIETSEDVECGSMSPDGRFIAVGSKIKAKEFTADGTELETHRGHHGPVFHARYAPDGKTLATGSEDGMVRIWPSHETMQSCQEP